eukprot:SAG11_NODE_34911_length_269_cov_0.917647_1_plen_36_part_01
MPWITVSSGTCMLTMSDRSSNSSSEAVAVAPVDSTH